MKKIFHKDKHEPQLSSQMGQNQQTSHVGQQQSSSSGQQTSATAPSTSGQAETGEGVILHTTLGDITIALYRDETPKTCKNFSELARTGKYDNVVFHRIIPGFMIQGGDPTGTGSGGSSIYGSKFEDEIVGTLRHEDKGTLSMANSGPGTNGSQFFITLGATPHLNGKHTVFGHVVQGMDVVDKLGAVRTDGSDRPLQEVKIESCEVVF
ncbi:Uu.00g134610.m01.CDS01 [Anthostomella pinea]|uniref:Peptidyl-prolyl cis-trans isomerase n=1 Tax=Anthostomella pinea TaxID=933095 RepID=A0AAI8VP20_9PEZI|nr:Uu.00g134610.m01.CDS01 [Anthostomella pinea]